MTLVNRRNSSSCPWSETGKSNQLIAWPREEFEVKNKPGVIGQGVIQLQWQDLIQRLFLWINRVQRHLGSIEIMCAGVKWLSIQSVYRHNSEAHSYVYFKFVTFVDLYSITSVGRHQDIFESKVQYRTILWHSQIQVEVSSIDGSIQENKKHSKCKKMQGWHAKKYANKVG